MCHTLRVLSAYTANKKKQEQPNNSQGARSKTVAAIIIALCWPVCTRSVPGMEAWTTGRLMDRM